MTRCTVSPVIINNATFTAPGAFPAAPGTGIDAAGTGGASFATAWTGYQGIQFFNPGNIFVWYYNGATACNAFLLIGQKTQGDVFPYTQDEIALLTSSAGWIPPLSPSKYNQQDTSQFSSAPGGAIGTTGQGLTCIDFSATTTLAVRLYQVNQVT